MPIYSGVKSIIFNFFFQVSWSSEVATAATGEQIVKLYDEQGYSALKKVDDVFIKTPLFSIFNGQPVIMYAFDL